MMVTPDLLRFVAFAEHAPVPVHAPARRRASGAWCAATADLDLFTDAMHGMECGVWACEPGMWRIRFAANKLEFFCVLEGHVRLQMLMVRCTTCMPVKPG